MGKNKVHCCSTCRQPVKGHEGATGKGCKYYQGPPAQDQPNLSRQQRRQPPPDFPEFDSLGDTSPDRTVYRHQQPPSAVRFAPNVDARGNYVRSPSSLGYPPHRSSSPGRYDDPRSHEGFTYGRHIDHGNFAPPPPPHVDYGSHSLPPPLWRREPPPQEQLRDHSDGRAGWGGHRRENVWELPRNIHPARTSSSHYLGAVDSGPAGAGAPLAFAEQQPAAPHTNIANPHTNNAGFPLEVGMEFLTPRTVNTALNGEFASLDEFLDCNADTDEIKSFVDPNGMVQVRSVRAKRSIVSLYKWLEAWLIYMMLMAKAQGFATFYQMARYMGFILNIAQKFKIASVLSYDVRHRQRLAQTGSVEFSRLDHELFVTTFDVNAAKSNKCLKCGASDHASADCVRRTASGNGGLNNRGASSGSNAGGSNFRGPQKPFVDRSTEICFMFQFRKCRWADKCQRRHVCATCQGPEPQCACPNAKCKAATFSSMVTGT